MPYANVSEQQGEEWNCTSIYQTTAGHIPEQSNRVCACCVLFTEGISAESVVRGTGLQQQEFLKAMVITLATLFLLLKNSASFWQSGTQPLFNYILFYAFKKKLLANLHSFLIYVLSLYV
jgi:hypothetical protein